jgi:hypothetical protein
MHQSITTPSVIIALQVVTVARMAAQNHNPIGPFLEGLEDKERVNPARTRDTDDAQRGRIS